MAVLESRIKLLPLGAPAAPRHLAQSADAGVGLVVEEVVIVLQTRDIGLAEERCLHACDVRHLFVGKLLKTKRQGLLRVKNCGPVVALLAARLTHIEVEVLARHHHRLITLRRCILTRLHALPTTDQRPLRQRIATRSLVPDAGVLAILLDNGRDAAREVVLQLSRLAHSLTTHQRLTIGAALPLRGTHLVATDVDIWRGKQLRQLAYDIL